MLPPATPEALQRTLRERLEIDVADSPTVEGHDAPLAYLCHAFFETGEPDCVVWASRGSGKTYLAAVATMLDLVYKPGIEVRLLAGSLEQAGRMHGYLRQLFEHPSLEGLVEGRITEKRLRLTNGSGCELLAQSQASVRGTRVQKLRCDEVELFDEQVFQAAQLTTRTRTLETEAGPMVVRGAVECLSTLHRPFGLMHRLVTDGRRRVFKWSTLDVLERCGPERACEGCALLDVCRGRCKEPARAGGHLPIADAIDQRRRVSPGVFRAEMLCDEPRRDQCVFARFSTQTHVLDTPPTGSDAWAVVCGMDFGVRAPTVILWARHAPGGDLVIVRERVVANERLSAHADAFFDGRLPVPEFVAADPAGKARNFHTGVSDFRALADRGLRVVGRSTRLEEGIDLLRRRLDPPPGAPGLRVLRGCPELIKSLAGYHYPVDDPRSLTPVKDGHDHAVDALRYLVLAVDKAVQSRLQEHG